MASYYQGTRDIKKEHYNMGILLTEKKKKQILKANFKKRVGYELNLDNPQTFNEKIMWSKLYYQNPLITQCCDKYAVKDYVKETIGEEYIVKTIASWDNPEDIDFDSLPNQFALKVNWSSGYNIIVRDKSQLDIPDTIRQLKRWMQPDRNSYYQFFNWGFKHMKPVVYAEEYIEQTDGQVYDYKFFMFDGEMKMMFIATDRYGANQLSHDFFDKDFNHLPFVYGNRCHANPRPEKPKHYEKMLSLAEKLSKPFPFVRVDFYEVGDQIYLGEMTFYPGGGVLAFDPVEWDYKVGQWYKLPPKTVIDKSTPVWSPKYLCAKLKYHLKRGLKTLRKKIIRHDVVHHEHFITLFSIFRFPIYLREHAGRRYVGMDGVELRYKKQVENTSNSDLPAPEFDVLPPRLAYVMEDKITMDMKKHYCEQKGFKQLHYFPNLDNPRSYNEKLLWLALYYKNPYHAVASDKALAKEWIGSRIGYEYVVPLIGVYDNVNDIDFSALPDRFVMKANEGWGADEVILVEDKHKYHYDHLKALTSSWLYPWSSYYYNNMCITDEKPAKPLIVIEEFLDFGDSKYLDDYKFYCCNGTVKFAMIVKERGSRRQSRTFVDRNWNVLPFNRAGKMTSATPEKPKNLEKMFQLAETLCADFPFVRIDFYNQNGKIYVGEMTFTPGLFLRFNPMQWDFKLGELLDISDLVEKHNESK